jgi:MoxR-like ATPase
MSPRRRHNKAGNKDRMAVTTKVSQAEPEKIDVSLEVTNTGDSTSQEHGSESPVDPALAVPSLSWVPIDQAPEIAGEAQSILLEETDLEFPDETSDYPQAVASKKTEAVQEYSPEYSADPDSVLHLETRIEQKPGEIESIRQQLEKSVNHAVDLEVQILGLENRIRPLGAQIAKQIAKLKEKLKVKDDELLDLNLNVQNLNGEKESLLRTLANYQQKENELFQKKEELNRRYQSLQNLEEALDKRAAEFSPERVKELEIVNDGLRKQIKVMQDELDVRGDLLEEQDKEIKKYNRKDIDTLRSENQSLAKLCNDLSGELEEYRQNTQNLIHLKTTLSSADRLEKERVSLLQQVEHLNRELEEAKSQVAQEKTYQALYEQANLRAEELRRVLDNQNNIEASRLRENERVYDSLKDLVQRPEYNNFKKTLTAWPGDGTMFTKIKEHAANNHFRFDDHLIRAFLGAVRSSRIIILKGFSGTGKSSLPQLVASAISAPCEVIPVQPSWRSKVDLLGFYNHFDQRFVPTAFTKALIKSLLPAFQNRHFFVLLDEMNLARVEYYFSDFNSKLQSSDPKIELFENASLHPRLVLESGRTIIDGNTITIPDNVTFIGTINDDETTFSISDKIYDRAQVIDFQNVGDEILKGKIPQQNPKGDVFSYSTFKDAWDKFPLEDADRQKIDKFLKVLNRELKERFYLNLSYRPRNQIFEFAQAYQMSGGSLSEALDLQIVSKVVPKIRYTHHGNFKENLDQLKAALLKDWPFAPRALPYTEHALGALSKQG